MRRLTLTTVALAVFLAVGCGAEPAPATEARPSQPTLLPLPENAGGIPRPGDLSVMVDPRSPSGELEVGVAQSYLLGHCGLVSPIDMDGSLWNPIGGHDGAGGSLTDEQLGELINATSAVVVLTDANTAQLRTPSGAVITLARHDGPRAYFLCD